MLLLSSLECATLRSATLERSLLERRGSLSPIGNDDDADLPSAANTTDLDEVHARISEFKREAAALPDPYTPLHSSDFLHGKFSCPDHKLRDEANGSEEMDPNFFLGFELRWHPGGGFDGVYMDETAAAYASADSCLRAVHATLERAVKMGDFVAEIGHLPGSNGGTPARRIRYYPSDAGLKRAYGCSYFDQGYNCTEESVPPETCPVGAPPLLVHTAFLAHQWPSVSCVRLIPNVYQLMGGCVTNPNNPPQRCEQMSYAGFKARKAYEASVNLTWFERTPQLLYIGTVNDRMAQRAYLHSMRWRNHDEERLGTASWLSMPSFLNYTDAASYRFLLDIGGSSGTTWDALQWKLASGALVFKAKNAEGAADLWHRQLKDGQQLLEVAADFSDLHQKVNWALAHATQAEHIAAAGQRAALKNENRSVHVAALAGVLRAFAGQLGSKPQPMPAPMPSPVPPPVPPPPPLPPPSPPPPDEAVKHA